MTPGEYNAPVLTPLCRSLGRLLGRLEKRVLERPWQMLGLAGLLALLAGLGAARVRFDASYAALLPADAPAMREMDEVKRALGGGSSDLIVVLDGPEAATAVMAERIVHALADHPLIAWADDGLPVAFLRTRALWLLPLEDVRRLESLVEDAYKGSIARAMSVVDADEDEADPWQPVRSFADDLTAEAQAPSTREAAAEAADRDHAPGRYVFVRPRLVMLELAEARQLMADIRARVDALRPGEVGVEVRYAGRQAIHLAEQQATSEDMTRATLIALLLIVLLMSAVARRWTAPLAIALPLCLSLLVTLALSALVTDALNLISAFTLPALVGLGVDFGIHLYLGFLAERRHTTDARHAMSRAVRATIGGSATSAATTGLAFFALCTVEFRGFREFGLLGGCGVLCTFAITYLMLPPLALLLERLSSRRDARTTRPEIQRTRAALPVPRGLAAGLLLAAVVLTVVAGFRARELVFSNDFGKLGSGAPVIALTEAVEDDLGVMLSPSVFLVPDIDAARALAREAEHMRARDHGKNSAANTPAVRQVLSVAQLLPRGDAREQAERAAALERTAQILGRVMAFGELSPEDERALARLQAQCEVAPWTIDELPEPLRRRLLAADGRGVFVYVWPDSRLYRDSEMRGWVARMDQLAATGRELGLSVRSLDERRLPMHVVDLVARDLPAAMTLSCALVLLVLFAHFRRATEVLAVAAVVCVALCGTLAILVVTGEEVNVYNAVVLPCLVGIAIDNAVHIQHAYRRAGPGSLARVLDTTGVAAVLASATTGIGFGAALIARQGGLRSMGLTAVAGAGCILLASTVLLPAWLHVREARAQRKEKSWHEMHP